MMKTSNPRNFDSFSVKECLCVILLLTPVTLAKEGISLKITKYSPSQVEMSCRLDDDTNMTDVSFNIHKAQYSCLFRTADYCRETIINNCKIDCLATEDIRTLPFLVKLDGKCDEIIPIRCEITKPEAADTLLHWDDSIRLVAQSDPPLISINDGQPVVASCHDVQVVCTVQNMCKKTKLDILGKTSMKHSSTTHTKSGNRFMATAISYAKFNEAGNHTIVCQERGKGDLYSRNYTLEVHPNNNVSCSLDPSVSESQDLFNPLSIGVTSALPIFFVLSIVFLGLYISLCRHKGSKSSDPEAEVPLLPALEDRYKEIEEVIQKLTPLNIEESSRRIFSLVNEGEITYPEYGHSIIYQVIEKMEHLHREPQYPTLIQILLPSYQKSTLSKKEDLSQIIWEKLEYGLIQDGTEAQNCLRKLMNFSLDTTLSFRLLWRCALDSIILEEINKLNQHHWTVVRLLIAYFAEKTKIFIDPQCGINTVFLQEILDGYKNTVIDTGVLYFLIQSVPEFILKHESKNILSIKDIFVKECCKMLDSNASRNPVDCEGENLYKMFNSNGSRNHLDCEMLDSNALCNHVDTKRRTPLHKLLQKLLGNALWWEMSELVAGTDKVWDLISQLISHTDVNIRDKKEVTPYSWILWWKESLPYQDVPDKLNLENKLEEITNLCRERVASEELADDGLRIHREKEFREILKRFVSNKDGTADDLFRTARSDLDRITDLCLNGGVIPRADEIYDVSLFINVCTTPEALLATLEMMGHLIGAHRKQHKTEPIKINLNPLQNHWKVRKDLITAASTVIRAAYCTLGNCMESMSMVNSLLCMNNVDGEIKKCFERANAFMPEKDKQNENEQILIKRNGWFRRSMLHLAAMFCYDEQVLKCIPEGLVQEQINEKDIHGCTPLHVAYLHDNQSAVNFLKSKEEKLHEDYFGKLPDYLKSPDAPQCEKSCFEIFDTNASALKNMLVLQVNEYAAVENDLVKLFNRIVDDDAIEIIIGGSVREKLNIGILNEFDLQICVKKDRSFGNGHFASAKKMHDYLVKQMAEINMKGIPLRCISFWGPWIFIYEGENIFKGQEISVNVVFTKVKREKIDSDKLMNLRSIIDDSPDRPDYWCLQLNDFCKFQKFEVTSWEDELDISKNLSPGCRLGILISVALVEVLYRTQPRKFSRRLITKDVVKSTLLWILAGRTPRQIENEYGNVIGERYGALRQQLLYKENDPKWMTLTDFSRYAEDGKFWSYNIFDAIQFVAEKYRKKLGNFLWDSCHVLEDCHEIMDLLDTCKTCLDRWSPEVFFPKTDFISETMESKSRTRLQEVINTLNAEAETMPGALLRKKKKLESRIKDCCMTDKADLEKQCKALQEKVRKLTLAYARDEKRLLLSQKERACEMLEGEIQKFIEKIGQLHQKESLLFRLTGEYTDEQRDEKDLGLIMFKSRRNKSYSEELKNEINQLRSDCRSHLRMLEEKMQKQSSCLQDI